MNNRSGQVSNIAVKQHAEILSELRRVLFVNSVIFITARGVANIQWDIGLFLMKRIWVPLDVKLQKPTKQNMMICK